MNTLKKPILEYPFGLRWSPDSGVPYEVRSGVFWLRMPLPIALDHINLWLLRDGDEWVIVDCGYDHPSCKDVWEQVFDEFLDALKVNRIIVTHFHPDHIGLASWLANRCDCKVHISKGEYRRYRAILESEEREIEKQARSYLLELNYPPSFHAKMIEFFKADEKPADTRVRRDIVEFIQEDDIVKIDDSDWLIVSGNGHSPEHSCLFNRDKNVMISGDQAIPRISSNVSVYLANRHDDPLGDWINSCEKLRDTLPPTLLVLPAHQEPFIGIKQRMQHLIDDHHLQLDKLKDALSDNRLTVDKARAVLFDRELGPIDTVLATGETQAHLNYLLHREEINKDFEEGRAAIYSLR